MLISANVSLKCLRGVCVCLKETGVMNLRSLTKMGANWNFSFRHLSELVVVTVLRTLSAWRERKKGDWLCSLSPPWMMLYHRVGHRNACSSPDKWEQGPNTHSLGQGVSGGGVWCGVSTMLWMWILLCGGGQNNPVGKKTLHLACRAEISLCCSELPITLTT